MVAKPESHPAFESLDRFAITEMRPPTSPAGVVAPFYNLVRDSAAPPLSYQIAQAILGREKGKVLIVTGLVDAVRFPCGEIDGPIGSIALARALTLLGFDVTIIVDAEAMAPIQSIMDAADLPAVTLRRADLPDTESARRFGAGFDIVVAVEKLGRNSRGTRHLVWGTLVDVGDPYGDDYVQAGADSGALTIGIGDNGNEIGFGNIREQAEPLTPAGVSVAGGFFAATLVDYLFPASVSNFGCYTLVAALAICAARGDLVLDGEQIRRWTEVGLDAGLRSGGVDDVAFRGDDGIPTRFVAATAEIMAGIVHQALLGAPWVAKDLVKEAHTQ
ncbi:glutamate cyclase domain-containing protein [Antrihabitans sp. YC2-6]|uniref:glutamate cyclase domain-containing protein n=1 Tax=Antrihabitans sp. YC2-6 TaxID=2799498 RepID=UPI0018F61637|nr:glutamate cyclase domain-containing protein [Antrihabitans sp. YC2-6]MBJ8344318.1 DUF4392 domain-containing protein [Antrihabitans sp. YC2-6]